MIYLFFLRCAPKATALVRLHSEAENEQVYHYHKNMLISCQNRSLLPLCHFAAICNPFIINESCSIAAIAAKK